MNTIEQQILAGLAVLVLGAFIVGVAKYLIDTSLESVDCLKKGQADIVKQCQAIAVTLAEFNGKNAACLQWHEMHQADDDRQFQALVARVKEIHEELNDMPCKKT